jgi:hypothetical protein
LWALCAAHHDRVAAHELRIKQQDAWQGSEQVAVPVDINPTDAPGV